MQLMPPGTPLPQEMMGSAGLKSASPNAPTHTIIAKAPNTRMEYKCRIASILPCHSPASER
jgi:hypothetical protein